MKKHLLIVLALVAVVGVGLYAIAADPPNPSQPDVKAASDDAKGGGIDSSSNSSTGTGELSATGDTEFNDPSRSPAEMYSRMDPAFSKHVDLSLLAEAMAKPDAALLVDVALGLAEGERVLVRNHRSGLNSEDLMARAVKLAARLNDKTTLDRISKAATVANKPQWAKLVTETKEFAGVSRDGPTVAIGKIDLPAVDLTHVVQRACDRAVITNQKGDLEDLKKTVASARADQKVKEYLTGLIESTLKSIAQAPDDTDDILAEFASATRDGGASAAVASYVLQEAVSFGRQLATGWSVSYTHVDPATGEFHITFKNRITSGPGGILVTPCWIDVKGNFATGTIRSVEGRGSDVARILARTMDTSFRQAAARFRSLWQQGGGGGGGGSYFDVSIRNNAGTPLNVWVHYQTPSNNWRTDYFTFSTGENARINIQTRNRNIYFRATSRDGRTWGNSNDSVVIGGKRFDHCNMGESIGRFTYTFSP